MIKMNRLAKTLSVAACIFFLIALSSFAFQDSPETAGTLPLNASALGNLGGENWWIATLDSYGSLTVETESDETLYLFMYLYDNKMNLLDSSERFGFKQQSVQYMSLAPGNYYIKTIPYDHTSGAYSITTIFVASSYVNENNHDNEPTNDIKEQAYIITTETTYTGHVGYYSEGIVDNADFYGYSSEGAYNLYIKIVCEPTLEFDAIFYDACKCGGGEPEEQMRPDGNHIRFYAYTKGCYVKIAPQPGTYGSYALRFTTEPYTAPEIYTKSLEQAFIGRNYKQQIVTADLDKSDILTFQLLKGPSWMSIDENGYLIGKPQLSHQGTSIPVTVKAIDNNSMEATLQTTIDVIFEVDPPRNFTVSDVPHDQGYQLELSWDLSAVDSYISHYNIYRSQFYEFTIPLSIESFDSIEELIQAEQSHTILITEVPSGTTSFTDKTIPLNNRLYYYWISAVDESGESAKTAAYFMPGVTSVEQQPSNFRLYPPCPNPFNPSTTISYEIPSDSCVSVSVYDILGRKVAVLVDEYLHAGLHEIVWHGTDDFGAILGSGVYLYSITAGKHTARGKLLFLR
ncbi:MAG: T9SS type A sorting domain-containing protein [Candidatus Latescibacteria bacterium]|nr:T9SS type A sorting domain-containing protein [Candidatus Latescibacterota bacterium]